MNNRARFVAAVLLLTIFTLGAAFSAVYFVFNRTQERQLDQAVIAAARVEARMLTLQPNELFELSNRPGPAANQVGPLQTFAAVLDGRGQTVSISPTIQHAPRYQDEPLGQTFDTQIAQHRLRAVWLSVSSRPGIRLFFAVPREDLDGDAAFLFRAMAAAFLAAVVWSAAIAYGIVRTFTNEQRRIAEVARRVADGDLTARISSRTKDQEVARFAHDLDQMIDRLALLVSSQQRFIAHAAHELRSPLTMLYGELSHALRRARTAEQYRQAIEEALYATRQLKQLSEDLLELARISAVSHRSYEPFAVRTVVEEAVASARVEAGQRSVEIAVSCEDVRTEGHARDLQRMLRNLLENAVRHSPVNSQVLLQVSAASSQLRFVVSDQGSGVDPSERERIFEPFFRSAEEAKSDRVGAGLGLAIARDIARAHGGDLVLRETPMQQGAVFEASIRYESQSG
ncbi:MAG: HAMP domain-containing sensor histidine kinase [Deltaproteobacteria bacterium]|nr:HAMP domain-containing sensor histidine kinase [Deltaproteobacteria bacterium]